jgi:hypothetical protein
MAFLLIFRSDEGVFSAAEFLSLLRRTEGVSEIQEGTMIGSLISGHFIYQSDAVIVELKPDLQTVAVSDSSPAGIEFAWRLQCASEAPLRMVDESYCFDGVLSDFASAADLSSAVREAQT